MDKLNENIVDLIASLGQIPIICSEFKQNPSSDNADKIIEIIENSEKKLLKVKENVVRIVREMEADLEEVNVLPSENGYKMNI